MLRLGWTAEEHYISPAAMANRQNTLVWCCKEAVFKWYGLGGVDFREHMKVRSVFPINGDKYDSIMVFKKNEDLYLDLHSYLFKDLFLSYVVT